MRQSGFPDDLDDLVIQVTSELNLSSVNWRKAKNSGKLGGVFCDNWSSSSHRASPLTASFQVQCLAAAFSESFSQTHERSILHELSVCNKTLDRFQHDHEFSTLLHQEQQRTLALRVAFPMYALSVNRKWLYRALFLPLQEKSLSLPWLLDEKELASQGEGPRSGTTCQPSPFRLGSVVPLALFHCPC